MTLHTASEMRQAIKMQEYNSEDSLARRTMTRIEQAVKDYKTSYSQWYSREEARKIDLTFTPLGYTVTYMSYDPIEDSYWLVIGW